MFLSVCVPPSSNAVSRRSRTSSCTRLDMQMPPGGAISCRRAATLTPSPKMSSPSTMMSPRLMPMRKAMRRSSAISAVRSAIAVCTSTAQRTALTTLGNSSSRPSPWS